MYNWVVEFVRNWGFLNTIGFREYVILVTLDWGFSVKKRYWICDNSLV